MPRSAICTAIFLLAITAAYPREVLAQLAPGVTQSAAQTATLAGTVVQQDGTPVAGAALRLDGPNAHLTTMTDSHGTFVFTNVPYGVYHIQASSGSLGVASRTGIVVKGDINLAIQYAAPVSGMKEIARVSTTSSGAQINVTAASIASVTPSDYAFAGNNSWHELLDGVPGVTVGGSLNGGENTLSYIPDNPFQPIVLSIDGSLPYESSTTFDGMPLSNFTIGGYSPGGAVDLSPLPLPLFQTADVVRGPGADAPSIVDSIGGSFVLHAPGPVDRNSLQMSFSNDPYGGYFSNWKATFRRGKLSGTVVYSFNNSPGPIGSGPHFGVLAPSAIDGSPIASGGFLGYGPSSPVYGQCYCVYETTLIGTGGYQSYAWSQHNGGIGLSYQVTPSITAQAFYAGSQAFEYQAAGVQDIAFVPDTSYVGQLLPGSYTGSLEGSDAPSPLRQSTGLLEEKITAYIGSGVIRLAALQNRTYSEHLIQSMPPATFELYGSACIGSAPATSACPSGGTLTTYDGTSATLAGSPFSYDSHLNSTNDDILASYETQVSDRFDFGASFVKTANSAACSYLEDLPLYGLTFSGGIPAVTETIGEFRVHADAQLSNNFQLNASYYITNADYHVPNPADPTGHTWTDSIFHYSAPRLGATWRVNRNAVIRAAAGGGFALPTILSLVGTNGAPSCTIVSCTVALTNINLQPEKSFGFDIGTDLRLQHETVLSADVYKSDLYGQFFQSVNYIGINPTFNLPTYASEYLNLAHSRFEGVNLSLRRDASHGIYWSAALGMTRGYIISVPPGFYNQAGQSCDFATGAGCQNTYAIPNQNFNGEYQTSVPYANGSAVIGYRWNPKKYVDLQANYQGNNNAYFVPAFMEFDAHASYPITRNVALLATFRNITGIYAQNIEFCNPNVIAPSVAGLEFPLFPIPYGPRTLIVTANAQL